MRPGTLQASLDLVGHGRVASIFGRLRPGVLVVDIDIPNGAPLVAELVAWCVERDLWHVVRDSGRPGHAHVFVVAGERAAELNSFCQDLRNAWRLGRARLDVRTSVRPLSAPHRSGVTPPLPSRLPQAARRLPAALQSLEATPPAPSATRRVVDLTARSVPVGIPRRPLPPDWADYLASGIPPAQVAGWTDASRSAVESTATWQMASRGWNVDEAWLAISRAHPHAMTKARGRGRRWWIACVWNLVVEAVTAQPAPAPRRTDADSQLVEHVDQVRAAFLACWVTRYPDPRRHTVRRVLDVLLNRMLRTNSPRVPCPQRDLELDVGLSRPTVAAALDLLDEDGWLRLDRTYDISDSTPEGRSHHVSLPERIPLYAPRGEALSDSLPPSSSTPLAGRAPLPSPTAVHLGPRLWHLYLALRTRVHPQLPAHVAAAAGWSSPDEELTARRTRTVQAGLATLAEAGLASCDDQGRWTAQTLDQVTSRFTDEAQAGHKVRAGRIAGERAAYALVRAGRGRWHQQRDAAIRSGRLARELGALRWWDGLAPAERERRRRSWSEHFRSLNPADQARIKQQLAHRRQEAGGLTEDQHHEVWLSSLSQQEYEARVEERIRWYRSQPLDTQRELVTRWEQHRGTWAIQRRRHGPAGAVAPPNDFDEALRLISSELGGALLASTLTLDRQEPA